MAKKQINKKILQTVRNYIDALIAEDISVDRVILFGSYAKGVAKSYSDIDLAIISKKFGRDPIDEMMTLGKISAKYNSSIEAIPFHPNDLNEKYNTLISEIKSHGQVISF